MKRLIALALLLALAGCGAGDGGTTLPSTISFEDYSFEDAIRVTVRSLHRGTKTVYENREAIDDIVAFLKTVKGTDRISGKGYYGGTYEVAVEFDDREAFGIAFGDHDSISYGEHEDVMIHPETGSDIVYNNRYTLDGLTIEQVKEFFGKYHSLH